MPLSASQYERRSNIPASMKVNITLHITDDDEEFEQGFLANLLSITIASINHRLDDD